MKSLYVNNWSNWEFSGEEKESYPLVDYCWPTGLEEISDTQIQRVRQETNCTVVFNIYDQEYYLIDTSTGKDMTQHRAFAFMIVTASDEHGYGYIPWDYLDDISIDGIYIRPEKYIIIMKQLKKQLQQRNDRSKEKIKEIEKNLSLTKEK